MQIIHETEYEETMKNTVEPYLSARRRELYVPGADYPFRNENKRITGKIHMLQYLSDAPKVWWSSVTVLQNPQRNTMKWLTIF